MAFDLKSWLQTVSGRQSFSFHMVSGGDFSPADTREWLVTNGLGSYASGCVSGTNTRKYHGLLVAALEPPVSRHVLWSRVDEYVDGLNLSTNIWQRGTVSPSGYLLLEAFAALPCPTWVYKVNSGYLIKQVVMLDRQPATFVIYSFVAGKGTDCPIKLDLHLLLNDRDFHAETRADRFFKQEQKDNVLFVQAGESQARLCLWLGNASYKEEPAWYREYFYPREYERGVGDNEDCFHSGVVSLELKDGQSFVLAAAPEASGEFSENSATLERDAGRLLAKVMDRQNMLLQTAGVNWDKEPLRSALVLAADQFLVDRRSTSSCSVIAGYHWFNDWGRDSAIALPGLTLATGRYSDAKSVLMTFQSYLSEGMIPNNFPDGKHSPHYNTSDATFWWAIALYRYYLASRDKQVLLLALPALKSIYDWHCKGTRYNLKVDAGDGLLSGGSPDVQLTWMDAKCGNLVVTPRTGKAVEICALWYNFLKILAFCEKEAGNDSAEYEQQAAHTLKGFQQFWNEQEECLYDVIVGDGDKDASIRPNQLLAVCLPFALLETGQSRSLLLSVEKHLLTPYGLRSLSPSDPQYKGVYGLGRASANQYDRDITYHQGTVWSWLIGPWIDARMRLLGSEDDENIQFIANQIRPLLNHFWHAGGICSISEIFDGDSPHRACGCIAQAWSVAELLRVITDYAKLRQQLLLQL